MSLLTGGKQGHQLNKDQQNVHNVGKEMTGNFGAFAIWREKLHTCGRGRRSVSDWEGSECLGIKEREMKMEVSREEYSFLTFWFWTVAGGCVYWAAATPLHTASGTEVVLQMVCVWAET